VTTQNLFSPSLTNVTWGHNDLSFIETPSVTDDMEIISSVTLAPFHDNNITMLDAQFHASTTQTFQVGDEVSSTAQNIPLVQYDVECALLVTDTVTPIMLANDDPSSNNPESSLLSLQPASALPTVFEHHFIKDDIDSISIHSLTDTSTASRNDPSLPHSSEALRELGI
jgi:hypothetical protein